MDAAHKGFGHECVLAKAACAGTPIKSAKYPKAATMSQKKACSIATRHCHSDFDAGPKPPHD
eukprot:gene3704-53427_t